MPITLSLKLKYYFNLYFQNTSEKYFVKVGLISKILLKNILFCIFKILVKSSLPVAAALAS